MLVDVSLMFRAVCSSALADGRFEVQWDASLRFLFDGPRKGEMLARLHERTRIVVRAARRRSVSKRRGRYLAGRTRWDAERR